MNCPHCGAPMTLFRDRDYYYCEHCQSYHFPRKDLEGLRILGKNPEGKNCSHCQIPLNLITFDDFFRGYQCPRCRGLLFNRTTFREAIDFSRSQAKIPPEPYRNFDPAELNRISTCPICQARMETFQYNGPGNIVIDTCHSCDLIWLDFGELQKVINAPGRDRGVPQPQKQEHRPADQDQKLVVDSDSPLEQVVIPLLRKIFSR